MKIRLTRAFVLLYVLCVLQAVTACGVNGRVRLRIEILQETTGSFNEKPRHPSDTTR
jgi:hypothetical protein